MSSYAKSGNAPSIPYENISIKAPCNLFDREFF